MHPRESESGAFRTSTSHLSSTGELSVVHGFDQESAFVPSYHLHCRSRMQGRGTIAQGEPEGTPEAHPSSLAGFEGFIDNSATEKEAKAVGKLLILLLVLLLVLLVGELHKRYLEFVYLYLRESLSEFVTLWQFLLPDF